jgi:hypothetical protein
MGMFLGKRSENYAPSVFTPGIDQFRQEKCGNAHRYGSRHRHLFLGTPGQSLFRLF